MSDASERKKLKQLQRKLRLITDEPSKNPRQRRQKESEIERLKVEERYLKFRLGVLPTRRYNLGM